MMALPNLKGFFNKLKTYMSFKMILSWCLIVKMRFKKNLLRRDQQCYSSVSRMPNMTSQPSMVMNHEPTIMQTYLERQGIGMNM